MTAPVSFKNLKAYTSPRRFSGFQIPISLQSMAIRRYCEERGFRFNLHANENITHNSHLVLERLISDSTSYEGIAMCSAGMLPTDRVHRVELVQRALESGLSLHFVFEQMVVSNPSQIAALDELVVLSSLGDRVPDLLSGMRSIGSV